MTTVGRGVKTEGIIRRLNQTSDTLAQVQQRLSSGLRINRASDDAAGLSVSSILNVKAKIEGQGIRNLSDGISLLSITDQALSSLSEIVTRQIELAEQAANGVLSDSQRVALNEEAQALHDEHQRILSTTSFNNLNLLSGEQGAYQFQAGLGESASLEFLLREYGEQILGNEQDVTFGTGADTANFATDVRFYVRQGANGANDNLLAYSFITTGGNISLKFESFMANSEGVLTRVGTAYINTGIADPGVPGAMDYATFSASAGTISVDVSVNGASFQGTSAVVLAPNGSVLTVVNGVQAQVIDATSSTVVGNFSGLRENDLVSAESGNMTFQADISFASSELESLSQRNFSVSNESVALIALSELQSQLTEINAKRSVVGAGQGRTEVALNVLKTSREQNIAAVSRIVDADIGNEVSNLLRLSILQESNAAVLAQANLQGELTLQLLNST